ncbi:MAG: hemolysin family protein [Minisyncoccia bacterium]
MTTLILLILLVIIGSGLFSGMEAALFSVPQSRVMLLAEQNIKRAVSLLKIKQNLSQAVIVIVIGNNIINIVGSIFVGVVAADLLGSTWLGVVSAILTILIIIFGEILPKTIGENHAEKISLFVAPLLAFAIKVLKPVVWLFEKMTSRFIQIKKIVSEEELQMLSELGHLEGSIEEDERDIIQKVFTLNDMTAADIMTPRTVLSSFQRDAIIGEIRNDIYNLNNSRLPVYNESVDNVIGVCYRKNLLIALAKDQDDRTIESFTQDILYVSEDMRVDDLLQLFLTRREQIAVVKDKFEGTSGLVTLEDVLEQLVGEIVDEDDEVVDTRIQAEDEAKQSSITVEESEDREIIMPESE